MDPVPGGGGDPGLGAGAADWLRKENHHLLEENARLRVNLSALSKAAGGEVDIDRLRKKLSAAGAVVAERDQLRERLTQLEAQHSTSALQAQLDEVQRGWQQRHDQLVAERTAAVASATSQQQQIAEQLEQLQHLHAQGDTAQQQIVAAEAAVAEWKRQCTELRTNQEANAKVAVAQARETTARVDDEVERRAAELTDAAKAKLKAKYTEKYQELKRKYQSVVAAKERAEETQQASEQRVKAAQQDASAWQQRCKRVEDEYAASNDHMTAQQNFGIEHAEALASLEDFRQREAAASAAHKDVTTQLDAAREAAARDQAALTSKYKEKHQELKRKCQDEVLRLTQEHGQSQQSLEAKHAEALASMQSKHDEQLKNAHRQMQSTHEQTVAEMKAAASVHLEAAREASAREQANLEVEFAQSHETMAAKYTELAEAHSVGVEEASRKRAESSAREQEALDAHATAVAGLAQARASAAEAYSALTLKHASLQENHGVLQDAHNALSRDRGHSKIHIETLESDLGRERAQLAAAIKAHSEAKVGYDETLAAAKASTSTRLDEAAAREAAISAAHSTVVGELEEARASWEQDRSTLENEYAQSQDTMVGKCTQLQAELSASVSEAAEREQAVEAGAKAAEAELEAARMAAASQRAALEAVRSDLVRADAQILMLTQEHGQSQQSLEAKHAEALASVQSKHDELESAHRQMQSTHEQSIAEMKAASSASLEESRAREAAASAAHKDVAAELEQCRVLWEKDRAYMKSESAQRAARDFRTNCDQAVLVDEAAEREQAAEAAWKHVTAELDAARVAASVERAASQKQLNVMRTHAMRMAMRWLLHRRTAGAKVRG